MSQNALAQLALRALAGLLEWVHAQPPKRRKALYLIGMILAVLVLLALAATWLLVPSARGPLKTIWLAIGPVVLLVVSGLGATHVDTTPAATDANYDTGGDQ